VVQHWRSLTPRQRHKYIKKARRRLAEQGKAADEEAVWCECFAQGWLELEADAAFEEILAEEIAAGRMIVHSVLNPDGSVEKVFRPAECGKLPPGPESN
jgi:hypothetical protein